MNISLKVDGQSIQVDEVLMLASDTINEVDCSVQLSSEWSDFDLVKCVWENQRIADKYVTTITNGTTTVPWEVLTEQGSVRVNLIGYDVTGTTITERLTTFKIQCLNVKQKVNVAGSNSANPTAAEWEQQLTAHTGNTTVHVTAQNKTDWNAKVGEAPSDSKQYARKNGAWAEVDVPSAEVEWGDISGTLADQEDLAEALEGKSPTNHNHNTLYYGKSEVYTKTKSDSRFALASAITDMATKTWVNAQGFITSLAGYATEAWVNAKNYATQSWVEAKGYLTEHQSLNAYRTSADQDVIDGGKEDKSNKVTSFGTTPSDTKYPSEKLVKDSLDAKAELPTIVNDRYLHTNSQGVLEWSDLSAYEATTNKVTSVSSASTDSQYPSAKCLYDMCGDIESLLAAI